MEKKTINHHASIKITRFCMSGIGMWHVEKPRDKIISNIVLCYTIATTIIALIVEGFDIYHCLGDLHAISYTAPCTITVIIELFKLTKFVTNRTEVMAFNDYTFRKFWSIPYIDSERKILDDCNKKSIKIIIIYIIILQLILWQYITIPIIESYGKTTSERTLPFNLWFTFIPFKETPYYEIFYTLQTAATMSVCACATTFATFLFTINLYVTGQFKILQQRLETACCTTYNEKVDPIEKSYTNLRKSVELHHVLLNYIARIEKLYCQIMLVQTLGSVLQICFSGFQILLGVDNSILRTMLSAVFFSGSISQLLLYSWSCHEIIIESLEVAEAAYRAYWYSLSWSRYGKSYRQALLIIIARSRRPCILTVGKFVPMSLETFTSVFNTSLSYFTILLQMNEEIENN
ncbi:odorant receptor Or2-like [Microplitis demolitor]|uniref:odorant receptor Or2-like n=1 Tax=Microplitis demolitor TaxID=69319 RepID=UPI00235B6FD1|nr:odorant receptor Or2-like [Microplitis demolitor]